MAINRLMRRQPLGVGTADSLEDTCVEYRTPLSQILLGERADQVRLGLGRLGALDRDTLVAFYFDGRSLVEMSRQFRRRWERSSGGCTWPASGWPRNWPRGVGVLPARLR